MRLALEGPTWPSLYLQAPFLFNCPSIKEYTALLYCKRADVASWPQAAKSSSPCVTRTNAKQPRARNSRYNGWMDGWTNGG